MSACTPTAHRSLLPGVPYLRVPVHGCIPRTVLVNACWQNLTDPLLAQSLQVSEKTIKAARARYRLHRAARWTVTDRQYLASAYMLGESIDDLAIRLNRTRGAIRTQLSLLGVTRR